MRLPLAPLARVLSLLTALACAVHCSSESREGGTNTNWICSSDADCVGAPDRPVCSEGLCAAASPGRDAGDGAADARAEASDVQEASSEETGALPARWIDERCDADLTCTPGDGGLGIAYAEGACAALPSGCEGDAPVAETEIVARCRSLAYSVTGGLYCGAIRYDLDPSGCVTRLEHDRSDTPDDHVFEQCALAGIASYRWPCLGERDFIYESCTIL